MTADLYWLWEDKEEMYSLIYTFSHSFIQQMFIEHLVNTKLEQNKSSVFIVFY